jgi:DNA-3-methyladenine glycosylase II
MNNAKDTTCKGSTMIEQIQSPSYWDEGCEYLINQDPNLGRLIHIHRADVLTSHGDVFKTLINAIVGQQISVVAAQAIWTRLLHRCNPLVPDQLSLVPEDELRDIGLSRQKASYIIGISQWFTKQSGVTDSWFQQDDETIKTDLMQLKGVGPWTAEMVLIFSYLRPDVLPLGDIGLLRSAAKLYGWDDSGKDGLKRIKAQLEPNAEIWRPYRTIATWYLWRDLDAEPVLY